MGTYDLVIAVLCFVYSLDELLYLVNYGKPLIRFPPLFLISACYLIATLYVSKRWRSNKHNVRALSTGYYDCNGETIRVGDRVTYCGKIYMVGDGHQILGFKAKAGQDSYILFPVNIQGSANIPLAEAIQNKEEKLTKKR